MKIGILNLEPKYRNFALDKVACYWKRMGEDVEPYFALVHASYDKIYCSSIFTFTDKQDIPDGAICGGSGFDLTTNLPFYIEKINPHLNYGFTSRGCIRKCPFCIVPQKEGNIRAVADLYDIWDRKSRSVVFMDNNILALPEHFKLICKQANAEDLWLDFNQGLDWRLVTDETIRLMQMVTVDKYWRFAWDNVEENPIPCLEKIMKVGESIMVYCLIGFNTTEQEDLFRIETLRRIKADVFAMAYDRKNNYQKRLCRWVNHKAIFKSVKWNEYKQTGRGEG